MRLRIIIGFGLTVLALAAVVYSCKKTNQTYEPTLLTASPWTLASVQTFRYLGPTVVETDTLNTKCLLKQIFTFSGDNTCNYQNFICKQGISTGNWQLSDDKLTLISNLTARDTTDGGRDTTDAPFKNAQVINLGSYSLVLQTGDVGIYFGAGTKHVVKRYSFIHQ